MSKHSQELILEIGYVFPVEGILYYSGYIYLKPLLAYLSYADRSNGGTSNKAVLYTYMNTQQAENATVVYIQPKPGVILLITEDGCSCTAHRSAKVKLNNSVPSGFSVLKKQFKGFYQLWTWRTSWVIPSVQEDKHIFHMRQLM